MNDVGEKRYSKHARIRSRRSAVQAYYQWLITQEPVSGIISEFKQERSELKKADINYFDRLMEGMVGHKAEIDTELQSFLDRPGDELDPVENAVLHLGAYELLYLKEVPCRVVISESVELAKMFGAEQSHKYINGVLDKLAHKHRSEEMSGLRR